MDNEERKAFCERAIKATEDKIESLLTFITENSPAEQDVKTSETIHNLIAVRTALVAEMALYE